jgi:PAS domain S-box-containing protein
MFVETNLSHQPFRAEYRLRRHDGQWRWAVDSATPRFSEDGSFLGYIGSVIDLTEWKDMESALRISEAQLTLAQTAAGIGSWSWGPQTKVASFSGEYFALYGLSRDHPPLSYDDWLSLVHPGDRERVHDAMQTALVETHALNIEFRVVHPDGSTRWLAGKGMVFCDGWGNPVRFTGVNYDVTERKLAEDELLRANEDLKQFAFAASHDLQEPLRVVINYTQLLERRYKDQLDEAAGKIIDTTVASAARMERLLKGLRDYWQVSERRSLQITAVDLNDVLEKALLNLQDAAQESSATVTHAKLPVVSASEAPMIQVFQNLLGNAMKYRSPDRALRIDITCESRASEYVISVADNGIGIEPQYANQIFGIFKRLHGQEYSGAGIGLSICQKIIERLGGKIWVESQDQGATFRFSLPTRWIRSGQATDKTLAG